MESTILKITDSKQYGSFGIKEVINNTSFDNGVITGTVTLICQDNQLTIEANKTSEYGFKIVGKGGKKGGVKIARLQVYTQIKYLNTLGESNAIKIALDAIEKAYNELQNEKK